MPRKKSNVPHFRPLHVPIVDNHTHIYIDPMYMAEGGKYGVAASGTRSQEGSDSASRYALSLPSEPSPSPALKSVEAGKASERQTVSGTCALAHKPMPQGVPTARDTNASDTDESAQRRTESGDLTTPILESTLIDGMVQGGIAAAITSGCAVHELAPTLGAARRHPGKIYAALAIHPNDAPLHVGVREQSPDGQTYEQESWHREFSLPQAIEHVARYAVEPEVVAIGETGLDYYRTGPRGREAQKLSFRDHIALAKDLDKPLQIHDREAHRDVVDILLKDGAPQRTVFHSFSGDAELAAILAEHGWYGSFSGSVTYPANKPLREACLALPSELILVETDAPYLTPVPYRGHPNAVWGAAYTAIYMAWLRNVDGAQELLRNATNAEVEAAWLATDDDVIDAWCAQLNSNTATVYGLNCI